MPFLWGFADIVLNRRILQWIYQQLAITLFRCQCWLSYTCRQHYCITRARFIVHERAVQKQPSTIVFRNNRHKHLTSNHGYSWPLVSVEVEPGPAKCIGCLSYLASRQKYQNVCSIFNSNLFTVVFLLNLLKC